MLRIDCKCAVDVLLAGKERAVQPNKLTARAWADVFTALDDVPPRDVSWIPAHTAAADVGRRRIGNGQLLSALDRLGNDKADRLAKEAVEVHRVPRAVRQAVTAQEKQVHDLSRRST